MSETVMIRARRDTRDKLKELSQEQGTTTVELLDRLVQEHEDAKILGWFESPDPATIAEAQADVADWDGTLLDGLDPAEDFSVWR